MCQLEVLSTHQEKKLAHFGYPLLLLLIYEMSKLIYLGKVVGYGINPIKMD
jgi:hypothetical protein